MTEICYYLCQTYVSRIPFKIYCSDKKQLLPRQLLLCYRKLIKHIVLYRTQLASWTKNPLPPCRTRSFAAFRCSIIKLALRTAWFGGQTNQCGKQIPVWRSTGTWSTDTEWGCWTTGVANNVHNWMKNIISIGSYQIAMQTFQVWSSLSKTNWNVLLSAYDNEWHEQIVYLWNYVCPVL